MDAYVQKKLRGKKLTAVRRLIAQRAARGKQLRYRDYGRKDGKKRPLTSDALVKAYQQEAHRQRVLIKKAELTQGRLIFVVEAFRTLLRDDRFQALLKAESLQSLPAYLVHQLNERDAL